jgi:putative transposase
MSDDPGMTYPRAHLIDSETSCYYHLVSRCVRRAWLCGRDEVTGRSYEHRRAWIEERILFLARFFSVDVYAYTVMSNHYHIVLYFDPLAPRDWSDEDVARRWLAVQLGSEGSTTSIDHDQRVRLLLDDPAQIQVYRSRLGSLSWYMRLLNHPLACRANREDACTGHFWEGRFRSVVLLDELAALACMAYVDLNPIRANAARRLDECDHTSIKRRFEECAAEAPLSPLRSGRSNCGRALLPTHIAYRELLFNVGLMQPTPPHMAQWSARVASMRRKQRAHGSRAILLDWVRCLGQRWTKALALPA